MTRLKRVYRDERGMVLIMAGLGFLAFMSAAMFAIDVGMLMVARTQAQSAADAGALAGAVALVFDDFNDRSATGPAVQSAITASTSTVNQVVNAQVSVNAGDVTFPALERVRVQVHRSDARSNPVSMFLAPMIGIDDVDVGAVATAEAVPANAATCIKPWAIPDKWEEHQTPAWDENDEVNMFYETGPHMGDPLPDPDIYHPYDHVNSTGYKQSRQGADYGRQLLLKPGNPGASINPGHFFPIALAGGTGADWYQANIAGCWEGVAEITQMVPVEPGSMTGPTVSGTEALIAKDPGAYWDDAKDEIVSSFHPSPRVVVIPVYDPVVYEIGRQGGRLDLQIANLVGFFIEDMVGNNVIGRIVPMTGLIRNNGGAPVPNGAFLRAIRLVE